MQYIIDANNLAGSLGILDEENFDKILIEIIKDFFAEKQIKACLVFDSSDPMGDKYSQDNIEVIIAPKDNQYYSCADDKILEIVAKNIENKEFRDEMVVVTNDIDLQNKVIKLAEDNEYTKKLKIEDASVFVERVDKFSERVNDDYFYPEDLEHEEQVKINDELRELWG